MDKKVNYHPNPSGAGTVALKMAVCVEYPLGMRNSRVEPPIKGGSFYI